MLYYINNKYNVSYIIALNFLNLLIYLMTFSVYGWQCVGADYTNSLVNAVMKECLSTLSKTDVGNYFL